MNPVHRINVLGVGISEINHATAVECVRQAIESGHKGYITVTGVHGVTECQRDEELRRIHNESFLSTPDGMPMVWMGRLSGSRLIDRVYGPDMMLNVMREGVAHGWRHFLFGGRRRSRRAAQIVSRKPDSRRADRWRLVAAVSSVE